MTNKARKRYSEIIKISNFKDRLEYLRLNGIVGNVTFGGRRYLNQIFYKTKEWKQVRREVILRDNGCDLAHPNYQINGSIYVHHINPITIDDIVKRNDCVFDLENLISVSSDTHNAIHYGIESIIPDDLIIRKKNDTCLWR